MTRKLYFLWDGIDPDIVEDEFENFTFYINRRHTLFNTVPTLPMKNGDTLKVYSKPFSLKTLRKLKKKRYWVVIGTTSDRFIPFSRKGLDVMVMTGRSYTQSKPKMDERSYVFSTILTIISPYLDQSVVTRIIGGK